MQFLTNVWICTSLVIINLEHIAGQWDPNIDDPQWDKPRIIKRTAGADQPFPPWDAPLCPPDTAGYCQLPPYYPYDVIERLVKNIGKVNGRSLAYMPYRYINLFLGVPYAKPPVYERRFKPPQDVGPNWDFGYTDWDASYYRDACPQELYRYQDLYYTKRNMSEDCLHLNIFAPNLTDRPKFRNENYPVMILIMGDDYKDGDSMLYPAHLIARKEVLVITYNYRLGALGFMTTLDSNSPGNYGLMDTIKMLQWVRKNIEVFGGNPDQVTLVGHGSGAAMVGLLMLSPYSTYMSKPLFHQAVLMSGSDLCEWATIGSVWNANAVTYTRDLGKLVGCGFDYDQDLEFMVRCLRGKHYEEMVNATASVNKRYGSLAGPFGPVVDGDILPDTPARLRAAGKFMKIKVIAGVTMDSGAYIVAKLVKNMKNIKIEEGIEPAIFKDIIGDMVRQRAGIQNFFEVVGAIEFEYTYWAKPDNKSAVRQNLIDLWSDQMYGSCVDNFLKYQAFCNSNDGWDLTCPPVYMYLFTHRSEYEVLPSWMGVPYGRDRDYFLGFPFFNETMGNITGIVPEQTSWSLVDRNISDFFQMTLVKIRKEVISPHKCVAFKKTCTLGPNFETSFSPLLNFQIVKDRRVILSALLLIYRDIMVSAELETINKPVNSTGSNISIIIETNNMTSNFLANKVVETSEIVSKSKMFDGRWSFVVLLVSLYGTTVVGFSYSLFALLYKDFILEFEVTTSTAGWIGSMHVGCGNIGVIFLGVAIERFGCRLVCLAGTMIASLGYFLSYYARHILFIYFSYGFLAGIGVGMVSMASVIATQQCFDKRRAFAGAVVTVGYSLGSITSGLVMRYLYEKISWQSVCILFACIILQMAVLATLALAPSSLPGAHKRSEGQTRRNKISEYTKLLCEPAILTFLLANFFVHIGLNTFYQHTPNRAMSLGVQPSEIAIWPMTSAIATMVAKLTGGLVANMPCVNRLLFYSAMIFLSGLTQTLISLCNDFPSIIAQGIVQSSFNGAFICLLTTICVDLKGINEIAKSQSLLALFVGSGVLISTPFAGFLYDATKNYDLTFIVTGVITLSGTFFSLLSNYYQRKKSRQSPEIL